MIQPKSSGVSCHMSKHFDVVEITASACLEDSRGVIAKGLNRARSLAEFGANGNSAVEGFWSTRSGVGNPSGLSASSSPPLTFFRLIKSLNLFYKPPCGRDGVSCIISLLWAVALISCLSLHAFRLHLFSLIPFYEMHCYIGVRLYSFISCSVVI